MTQKALQMALNSLPQSRSQFLHRMHRMRQRPAQRLLRTNLRSNVQTLQ